MQSCILSKPSLPRQPTTASGWSITNEVEHQPAVIDSRPAKVVAFIATVGAKVDQAIEDLMQDGKVANAYVGDALGSAAVEKLLVRLWAGLTK